MKRRFKNKKTIKFKILLYIFIFIFSLYIFLGILFNGRTINLKNLLLNSALKEVINKNSYLLEKLNIDLATPKNILYVSLNKIVPKKKLSVFSSDEETDLFNYENSLTEYVEDPNPKKIKEPIIYIYNTHQLEEYNIKTLYDYSIKPNVMIASYILREKFNELDIPSIVETANIKKYLTDNRLQYNSSYIASRYFAEIALVNNKSVKYMIDIHRDSTRIDKTLYEKNGKQYARIMFVVGLEHVNYKKNLNLAIELNKYIESEFQGISRGVLKKSKKTGNGIYNQDLISNSLLIEIGGVDNTIEQVYNTCEILAKKISEFIKERENGGN